MCGMVAVHAYMMDAHDDGGGGSIAQNMQRQLMKLLTPAVAAS